MRKNSRIDDLIADIIEYTFIEWLVRRDVFVAFKTNYEVCLPPSRTFRDRLRAHIQYSLRSPNLGPGTLISSAFLYTSAPEGVKFWEEQSDAWKRFCARLETIF